MENKKTVHLTENNHEYVRDRAFLNKTSIQEESNKIIEKKRVKDMKDVYKIDDITADIEALQDPNSDYVKSIEDKLIKERERLSKIAHHKLSMKLDNIKVLDDRIAEKKVRLDELQNSSAKEVYTANYKSKNLRINEIKIIKSRINELENKKNKLENKIDN